MSFCRIGRRVYVLILFIFLFSSLYAAGPGAMPDKPGTPPPGGHQNPTKPCNPRPVRPGDHNDMIYFRGARMYYDSDYFKVQDIKYERTDSETVTLQVTFSQIINPRSVKASSVIINGKPVQDDLKFSFNKKGDVIKINLPASEELLHVTIRDVLSFDGHRMETMNFVINE